MLFSGLDEIATDMFYFIKDTSGGVNFVNLHDKIGNEEGGRVKLSIEATNLNRQGVQVTFFDDIAAANYSRPGIWFGLCANINTDCHSWSEERYVLRTQMLSFFRLSHFSQVCCCVDVPVPVCSGLGYFSWKWSKQASDGMTMGPLPPEGGFVYGFSVRYLEHRGIVFYPVAALFACERSCYFDKVSVARW